MHQKLEGARQTTDDRLGQHGSSTVATLMLFTVLALGGVGAVGLLRGGIADRTRCAGDAIVNLGGPGGGCAEGAGDQAALLFPVTPPAAVELASGRGVPGDRNTKGGRGGGRGEDEDRDPGERDDGVEVDPSLEGEPTGTTFNIGGFEVTTTVGSTTGIGVGFGIDPSISGSLKPDGRAETTIGVEVTGGLGFELGGSLDISVVAPRPDVFIGPLPPNRPVVGDIPPRRGPGDGDGGGGRPSRPGNNGFGTVDGSNGTTRNPEIGRGGPENATPAPPDEPDDDDSSTSNEDREDTERPGNNGFGDRDSNPEIGGQNR